MAPKQTAAEMRAEIFGRLDTMAQVEADRRRERKPIPKGLPLVLERKERHKAKKDKDEAFRNAIWALDKGCSRATGSPLVRGGTLDWNRLGEVDHVINRSTAPELIYETSNGILLSKLENRLKKTPCPEAPEHHMFEVRGPENRRLPQRFTWRDKAGKITRRTKG